MLRRLTFLSLSIDDDGDLFCCFQQRLIQGAVVIFHLIAIFFLIDSENIGRVFSGIQGVIRVLGGIDKDTRDAEIRILLNHVGGGTALEGGDAFGAQLCGLIG